MAKAKKFGTFAGVFTPSLLTILGVIMYMRLGWVVGESGLVAAIGLILIAHIISVTTGLSVSSVATDKKVKAGGLYYMLSRSLGLPIGGSIGITLFVGTALSISLYIVGFSESFNNAVSFGAEGLMATRITGSITLTLITIVALISTSIALKAQFYILAAIGLSLISIVVGGLTGDHGLNAAVPALWPPENSLSLEAIFAIFFPAVTGFTAGVAMSGDLKDPKQSIPIGTMASIGVGLIVYLGLAFFIAYVIDRDELRSDYNILSRIAYFAEYGAPFVVAGIWGATLSSALGGILGAPRIFQAMAFDRVMPKFFAVGVGKSNEPRRALILTFVIAEMGVLIGELDLIARVVSMFYLSAYGFINLTSALESWSGSDFRPQFKIPRAISILGTAATFVVMFRLDFVAMLLSFLIIGGIFILLTRKQISIGFSDIWQGVWSEVLRTALHKVSRKQTDQRNWRPNILLFSGNAEKRGYMLSLGKSLVNRLGVVSSFELKEDTQVTGLVPLEGTPNLVESKGIFNRQFLCDDVYEGISTIASTYGFSGLNPNTVLMGWSRYAGAPYKFTKILRRFNEIDYNVLIMDYDRELGFRDYSRIDIWFRGRGRNLSFALTIIRFLVSSDDWLNAHVRVLTDIEKSEVNSAEIYKSMEVALENLRLSAEVKIVSSAQENRSFFDTLKAESSDASLVLLGLSDVKNGEELTFYERTDKLCDQVGSVVLYRASSHFREIDLEIPTSSMAEISLTEETGVTEELQILVPPSYPEIASPIESIHRSLEGVFSHYFTDYLTSVIKKDLSLFMLVKECVEKFELTVNEETPTTTEVKLYATQFLEELSALLQNYIVKEVNAQQTILQEAAKSLEESNQTVFQKIPAQIVIHVAKENLNESELKLLKKHASWFTWLKGTMNGKAISYNIPLHKMMIRAFGKFEEDIFQHWLEHFLNEGNEMRSEIQKIITKLHESILQLDDASQSGSTKAVVEKASRTLGESAEKWQEKIFAYKSRFIVKIKEYVQEVADNIEQISVKEYLKHGKQPKKEIALRKSYISEFPQRWQEQRTLYFNFLILDVSLKSFQFEFYEYMQSVKAEIENDLQDRILLKIRALISSLHKIEEELTAKGKLTAGQETMVGFQNMEYPDWLFGVDDTVESSLLAILSHFPKEMEVRLTQNTSKQEEEEDSILIKPAEIVRFVIQDEFIAPFARLLGDLNGYVGYLQGTLRDIVRIVSLSIDNLNDPKVLQNKDTHPQTMALLHQEINHLEKLLEELNQKRAFFFERSAYHLKDTFDKLDPYFIIKSAPKIKEYKRVKGRLRFVNNIQNRTTKLSEKAQNILIKLRYGRSQGVLLANKLQTAHVEEPKQQEALFKAIQSVIPSEEILQQLPLYYRQLFLRERNTSSDLWYERRNQRIEIEESIQRYQNTRSGALLITGETGNGKTFLAEEVGRSYVSQEVQRVVVINPPLRGSVNTRVFKSSIARATGLTGGLEMIFSTIPRNSVLIFDDLEMWWERSPEGLQVIEEVERMINRYSDKVLFIFTINKLTYDFINQYKNIESFFFKVLYANPFSAETLKKVLLFRQKSSRVAFSINGKQEAKLNSWKLVGFFNACFDISEGNIGVALQTWVSAITKVKKDEIQLEKPKKVSLEPFANIPPHLIVVLVLCLHHKRTTAPKLARLITCDTSQVARWIHVLKRYRIIEEKNGVLMVNRFVRPYLIKSFKANDIL